MKMALVNTYFQCIILFVLLYTKFMYSTGEVCLPVINFTDGEWMSLLLCMLWGLSRE